MPRWLKKTLEITSSALLGVFILFVVLLVGVRLFGIEPHIVLSGSMEPEIKTGALVYVDKLTPQEAQNLKAGDTVTYQVDAKGTKVTHKIYNVVGPVPIYKTDSNGNPARDENGDLIVESYAKDREGNTIIMYTTYGVNNVKDGNIEKALDGDPEVGNLASSNIVGKPIFSIPLLGFVASFVQNPPGSYVALSGCILLIATTFISGSSEKDGKKKKSGEETEEEPNEEVESTEATDPVEPEAVESATVEIDPTSDPDPTAEQKEA